MYAGALARHQLFSAWRTKLRGFNQVSVERHVPIVLVVVRIFGGTTRRPPLAFSMLPSSILANGLESLSTSSGHVIGRLF
jgi:hypothetical protein